METKPKNTSMPVKPHQFGPSRKQLDLSDVFEIINRSNSLGINPMVDRDTPTLDQIYEKQLERKKSVVEVQRIYQNEWEAQDYKLIGQVLVSTNFIEGSSNKSAKSCWQYCPAFHPGGVVDQQKPVFKTKWIKSKQSLRTTPLGLNLRSIAIRPQAQLTLRSLAAEMKCALKLVGDSVLWIFSRVEGDELNASTAILQIKKEPKKSKLELTFGILANCECEWAPIDDTSEKKEQLKFQFIKKQQLPNIFAYSESEDTIDLNVVFYDNGDDTLAVKLFFSPSKVLTVYSKQFIPVLKNCSMILAGSGNGVYLKACEIKQTERNMSDIKSGMQQRRECCCSVF